MPIFFSRDLSGISGPEDLSAFIIGANEGTPPSPSWRPGRHHFQLFRGEEALRESEAKYRSLVSAVPDLVFTFSRDGDYLSGNTSSAELLVQPPERLVGAEPCRGPAGAPGEQFKRTVTAALDSGTVQELDYPLDLDGQKRFFEARVAPASATT